MEAVEGPAAGGSAVDPQLQELATALLVVTRL